MCFRSSVGVWMAVGAFVLIGVGEIHADSRAERVAAREGKWYQKMDFGPAIAQHVQANKTMILKGLTVRLGADETHSVVYDTEMMSMNAAWKGWLDIKGTAWDGRHGGHPLLQGDAVFINDLGPGWAKGGSFDDPRKVTFGPLPRDWVKYKGHYVHGDQTVVTYTVGKDIVYEMPQVEDVGGTKVLTRTFNIPKASKDLMLRVANSPRQPVVLMGGESSEEGTLFVGVSGKGLKLSDPKDGQVFLTIPKGKKHSFKVAYAASSLDTAKLAKAGNLGPLMKGGPAQWPDVITLQGTLGKEKPYATDQIPLPIENPWSSKIKFSGFDFFSDGKRLAVCTWNGDVWIASSIDEGLEKISWKRYAAGLFETLGLKIVDDVIYVTCKDQIARLHDLNQDGEADYYECFNNDIMITKNFHEFTFGLQTDKKGNFYFSKGASVRKGGRGFETTTAHHGIVFKVSKDGTKSEVWANGLRAPGGIGVGPNGEVTTGENEGTYVPACRLSWLPKGAFAGVIHKGNGRTMEQGYDPPLCWMPMDIDNSGGGQVWVDSDKWGPFDGDMLHLSYGRSVVYKVLKEEVDGVTQGGVVKMPIKLASSAMRGRFNPADKQLYVSGFRGWQTNAATESALQRLRYTGDVVALPTHMRVVEGGIYITFTEELDQELAEDVQSYAIKYWNYLWGPMYGSAHFSVDNPDEDALKLALTKESKSGGTRGKNVAAAAFSGDPVPVKKATLQKDKKTVFLEIPKVKPVMQMEIKLDLETTDGDEIYTAIYNTIHKVGK